MRMYQSVVSAVIFFSIISFIILTDVKKHDFLDTHLIFKNDENFHKKSHNMMSLDSLYART